jgi:S-DNA-T family DNA segregation ATPase FtsK/SpoIIIE
MAAPKKKVIPQPQPESVPVATKALDKKRQRRLAFGTLFLLAGVFVSFAIISYFFTWKTDQDKFIGNNHIGSQLFKGHMQVSNWCGPLGAFISHYLVFNGAGVAALSIGIWLMAWGLQLLYAKQVAAYMRYMRWVALALLIVAPVLTFLFPASAFPFGGAWGNVAVDYLNHVIGSLGTALILLAVSCFFLYVIIALDIAPAFKQWSEAFNKWWASVKPTPKPPKEKAAPVVAPVAAPSAAADAQPNHMIDDEMDNQQLNIEDEEEAEEVWEMSIVDKTIQEHPLVEPEQELYEEVPVMEPIAAQKVNPEPSSDLSFEVITQEEEPAAIISHGAHISIEANEPYAPELDLPDYKFPTLDLLEDRAQEVISLDKEELEKNKNQILQTLRSFGIEIQRISATVGPTVTLYEIVPAEGVRISKIRNLEDDIALNLAALGIRIIAPIPGRGTIGIEVPNANKQIVSMRTLLASEKFVNNKMSLPIALGKKIDNENYIVDLATMPHLLMAGATGQGKSVGINAILVSLLYKKHPSQLKFVMVDPKKVELSVYRAIEKHFLAKLPNEEEAIITDTKKVINTLNALCIEMDNRYELLKEAGARNIKEYNEKFISRRLNPENGHKYLPFIVLVIDEFADLIMTAGKEVEMPIARLAQLARAIGIHLIIATQRPSVNVITGTIKANFPGRIAFKVSAKVDSRTILDTGGAEQLIGRGDMLVSHGSELLRLQCAFVDTPEVEHIVNFIGKQRGYASAFELPEYEGDDADSSDKVLDLTNRDKLFEECAYVVVQTQNGSTSNLQRRFNLGYNRAGRIMDQLEAAGVVGPGVGSKPREVLYKTEAELQQFLSQF